MNGKRILFVFVGYLFIAASFQATLFPWTLLFGMIGGCMIGHASTPYVKGH